MEWVVNTLNEVETLKRNEQTIRNGADAYWKKLQDAIQAAVATFRDCQSEVPRTDIKLESGPDSVDVSIRGQQARVILERKELAIVTQFHPTAPLKFLFDLDGGTRVRIRLQGGTVDEKEFCRLILEDVFFPDLKALRSLKAERRGSTSH